MPTASSTTTHLSISKDEHPLLQDLARAVNLLPSSIPIGISSDTLAVFSSPPTTALLLDGQDPWEEVVNPTFDQVFGFGATAKSIQDVIRRGEYGMTGVFYYLKCCIHELGIDAGLLEGRIGRIVASMVDL